MSPDAMISAELLAALQALRAAMVTPGADIDSDHIQSLIERADWALNRAKGRI